MLNKVKKPRVIHILGDSEYGGGSKIVESIILASIRDGFDVGILSTNIKMMDEAKKLGAHVHFLKCIKSNISPLSDLIGIIKLCIFLKRNRFDIVHTHTTKAGMIGRLASLLAGVPLIFHTVHGFAFSEHSGRFKVKFYALIERICAKACTKLITVSKYHKDWAVSLGIANPDKIIAIPNGLENDKKLVKSERKQVIFVGRMVREKGVEDLLKAFAFLLREKSIERDVVLELYGDGPDKPYFESLSDELGLIKHVTFYGFVKQEEMEIQSSSIFVLPSYREGFSISLLEAMSLGLPIVATNIGGNKEALANGEAGLLYTAGEVNDLARCLAELLNNPEKAKLLSLKAKTIFYQEYTLDKMTSSYISLYKNSLGELSEKSKG